VQVKEAVKSVESEMVEWRRHIHQHPEMGLDTVNTAALVSKVLREAGLEVREKVGRNGVVAILRGTKPGPTGKTIALRADMDALPVQEQTGASYASKVDGVFHACGHDTHTALMMGAAKVLSGMLDRFAGTIKFIFQPGEEGYRGANLMIEDGCLKDPKPDYIFAGHVGAMWGNTIGEIGVRPGPIMASSNSFILTITGKGGHGGAPHQAVDPVIIAAHIAVALQTIVSREIDPNRPAVITIGKIVGGTARNIIPETCTMSGTVRYIDKSLEDFIPARISEIASGIARSMRAEAKMDYVRINPPVANDPQATSLLAQAAAKIVGPDGVKTVEPTMGAEDMAWYFEEIPGSYFSIGSQNPDKGIVFPNHHAKFNIDEDALSIGASVFVQLCLDYLGS